MNSTAGAEDAGAEAGANGGARRLLVVYPIVYKGGSVCYKCQAAGI